MKIKEIAINNNYIRWYYTAQDNKKEYMNIQTKNHKKLKEHTVKSA